MFAKILKHKLLLLMLIFCFLVSGGYYYYKTTRPVEYTMTLSLVYQNASSGLTPSGTRYDPYLIVSDEIISPIEDEMGIDLNDKIWIRSSPDTKGKSIAAEYVIHCRGLENGDEVLEKIAANYTDYFETHYTMNDSILEYKRPDKLLDYIEMTDYLEAKTSKITTFITKQIKLDESWCTADGANYQDLLEYGENILDIDIYNLRTFITQNGITKSATDIKNIYQYKNLLLEMDKQKAQQQYENRRTSIEMYDPTLFPTISVPSIKNGEYYVTTTKTGLDYIYDAASSFSESAYKLQTSISKNELTTKNIHFSGYNAEAEQRIRDIESKITQLIENTKKMDSEYKESKRTKYLIFGEVKIAK